MASGIIPGIIPSDGMKLLWTNPSPTASFAAQTVSLDLSQYRFVLIFFQNQAGSNPINLDSTIGMVGQHLMLAQGALYIRTRTCNITATGIVFEGGVYYSSYGAAKYDDGMNIPQYIYGIK